MKYITIILLLFTLNVSGQDRYFGTDKALHFGYSTALTMLCIETAKDYKFIRNPELTGVIVAFSVGMAKEVCYDKPNGSYKDLVADFAGCVSGVFINRFVNKQIEKHYKKKGWN
jgi:uncharacterized protein YfiM (DUF2279 family)